MAEGFERAVVSAAPGSALLLHPDLSFYWPDTRLAMFNIYCWAARILLQVGYTLVTESVRPPFCVHFYVQL